MIFVGQALETLFRNTLAPWQWLILGAIPLAIVALYFLKLKRQPLEVPSTYLWQRSLEDLHVNSLWQRIRQNLLMYLQLAILLLAMLALLRPGWQGTKLEGERFIFLVDNSASMQATDVAGAESRLADAKGRARALIDQMESGMTGMIISFSDTPQVVQEFTDNHRLLRERLETIKPTYGTTDLKGALDLADGLANPGRITIEEEGIEVDVVEAQDAVVFIFSDGRFDDVKQFSLGNLKPSYIPIGALDAENLAITAFTTRRSEARPEERQAFVQVTNFTDQPQTAVVTVSLDGQFLDAREVQIAAGEPSGIVFPLADAPPGALRAKLRYELPAADGATSSNSTDALALDDVAYASLNDATSGRVLVVTPGNAALQVALATARSGRLAGIQLEDPKFLQTPDYQRLAESNGYDLVVYDQCAPESMPRANTLFIGRLPPLPTWQGKSTDPSEAESADDSAATARNDEQSQPSGDSEAARVVAPQIIDWNRAHPLLAHVELGNVALIDSLVLQLPPGSDVLIDSTAGPILAIAPRDSYEDVVLGFEILGQDEAGRATINTNWPRRHSFPTFWLNVLEYLAGQPDDAAAGQTRPGNPIELKATGNLEELTVIAPDSQRKTIRRDKQDVFQYHDTQQPGVYEVLERDQLARRFAVNVFDHAESDVRIKPSQDPEAEQQAAAIRIGNVDVAAAAGSAPSRKETWRLLLIAVLVVLLVEWYIYNRRVYI